MVSAIRELIRRPSYRAYLFQKFMSKTGYSFEQWVRVPYIKEWKAYLAALPLAQLDALEISPHGHSIRADLGFRSYSSVDYPEFDITSQALDRTFDVIIAEQIFEHLRDPYAAARNVHRMLSPDGVFLIVTPFMIRVHGAPDDFTRWTEHGMTGFLENCGFVAETHSWGNRSAVAANFKRWAHYGWGRSLENEPDFPINVWAYARKMR